MEKYISNKFGYCFYYFGRLYSFTKSRKAIIYNLYIYPEYRRQGKAKELLLSVIAIIRSLGYEMEIIIEAIPKEDSISLINLIKFYKSIGLKIYNE